MTAPLFVDNQGGNTFAEAINLRLRKLREAGEIPEELCIATGYFNAAGWLKVAEEAERLGRIRLLIGAEPNPQTEMMPRMPGEAREPEWTRERIRTVLERQVRDLKTERDKLFEFRPDGMGALKNLLMFLRSGRIEVRRYSRRFFHAKAWLVRGENRGVLAGSSNLTAAGMIANIELNLGHYDDPLLGQVEDWFDALWEQADPFDLATLYEQLFQEFSPWLIYLRVLWELYGDELEQEEEETGGFLTLTRFQSHGIWRARRILEELGGVVVADGVGLGKTFTAGGLMEPYRDRRQRILLIRPAALESTWGNFLTRNYLGDVEAISYEKLAGDHQLGGDQHHLKLKLDEYQLVVVDEAHNYRNPDAPTRAGVLRQVMRARRRDLVLLTATPVNNSLYDLYHLLAFFLKQDSRLMNRGIPSIKGLFDAASQEDPADLDPELLFPLVDATTVKRTREFIRKHYKDDRIPDREGNMVPITFPKPVPMTVNYDLDAMLPGFFAQFAEALMPEDGEPKLTMARYQVERYLLDPDEDQVKRDAALVGLLRSGLLKRFESSAHAFANTCERMAKQHETLLRAMHGGWVLSSDFYKDVSSADELEDDEFQELLNQSQDSEPLTLFDADALREDLENDLDLLSDFVAQARTVPLERDPKLDALIEELAEIAQQARDDAADDDALIDNRKVLVFSYYKDTALWIHRRLLQAVESDPRLACYRERVATTSGSPDEAGVIDSERAVWRFAPKTAAPAGYLGGDRYDILVATDVLAEGVNLQQCRHIINYDLPWNPMRLVQRHGRVDRLLSQHDRVFLRTYFPDRALDELLGLEERVRRKLALASASVGTDGPITDMSSVDRTFAETREEIERVKEENPELFERGGTESASQTGEEYRQQLREALKGGLKEVIEELPWKAGSGLLKGDEAGFFFCAKVGERTYLRFVPEHAETPEDVVDEVGTSLRMIECEESTERVMADDALDRAFEAWSLARDSIAGAWNFYSDSANLQPKVRKLNREVENFLMDVHLEDVEQSRVERVAYTLMSPWPMREENRLREVWRAEYDSRRDKAKALIRAVEDTGIEPYEEPQRLPAIQPDDVRLVVWMAVNPDERKRA